ncbi:hypothetical protein HDC36_003544 [Xanthomonas sp. JAI131]|uniref:hypothetical protein n=1 Tax=Xanthomonas sp. JAI131 TaxID=2723067 RepID=UPI0015C78974|nr:hypothetical protein [Xanthomonas sp. JAI131]NYF22068.1 hypothetical protein [Xanthomonas sp. JAI131]
MKVRNWWVKKKLLTCGLDPAAELSVASELFPDEYAPVVFMTGDGHRNPPFEWTNRGVWTGFFDGIMADNKLCCHVEVYADAVAADSVPRHLRPVFMNRKVFGWEPECFKAVEGILISVNALLPFAMDSKEVMAMSDIEALVGHIDAFRNSPDAGRHLVDEQTMARQFLSLKASRQVQLANGKRVVATAGMLGFDKLLLQCNRISMQLRTVMNDVMGRNIQAVIDRHPDHMHLITCGDAHVTTNPLYGYIEPPIGTFGIADEDHGRGL